MIFTYGYFEKNKLPKFYAGTAKLMKTVSNSVFFEDDDINRLHAMLCRQLEEDKPKGSTAYVDFFHSANDRGGGIYVHPDNHSDNGAVLRLLFGKVNNLFKYDEQTGHFAYIEIGLLTEKKGGSNE